eukprot:6192095-Pleurochrysis_carterae.AAC.3
MVTRSVCESRCTLVLCLGDSPSLASAFAVPVSAELPAVECATRRARLRLGRLASSPPRMDELADTMPERDTAAISYYRIVIHEDLKLSGV